MKIACLLPSLQNKGPVIVALEILKAIHSKVVSYDIFYFTDVESPVKIPDFKNVRLQKISFSSAYNFQGYDILHTHSLRPDLYSSIFRKKIGCRIISTLHNYVEEELTFTYNRVISLIFSNVWSQTWKNKDALVFLSEDMRSYYKRRGIGQGISRVIHNSRGNYDAKQSFSADDLQLVERIRELKKSFMIFGGCGVLNKRKGFEDLIFMLSLDSSIVALIVGEGPERRNLSLMADRLGVSERCIFVGFKQNVYSWMSLMDVFVMSSYSEGFPLVLLEAGNSGLPVFCVESALFKELFQDNEIVFYKRHEANDIIEALTKMKMSRNSYILSFKEAIDNRYSSEKMGNEYLNLYQYMLKLK